MDQIKEETEADTTLVALKDVIQSEWPEMGRVLSSLSTYYSFRDELEVQESLIFRGKRLVISKSKTILKDIHRGHSGVDGCLRLARDYVYWPGMTSEIRQMVQKCEHCREYEISPQRETLLTHDVPERPWQRAGSDLFSWEGKDYMVSMDYYSNFWEIDRLYDTSSKMVIGKLKSHYARYGIPDELTTDTGPQFDCRLFRKFTKEYNIVHHMSPPHHHQANGKAESDVKAAKKLLKKTARSREDLYLAMANMRNTAQQGIGLSPAQRLFGHRTKTVLPTTHQLLKERADDTHTVEMLKTNHERRKKYWDKSAKDLPHLKPRDYVRVKPYKLGDKSWKKAVVCQKLDRRSYEIETEGGRKLRRVRTHLRKSQAPTPTPTEATEGYSQEVQIPSQESHRAEERNTPHTADQRPNREVDNIHDNTQEQHMSPRKENGNKQHKCKERSDISANIGSPRRSRSGRQIRKPSYYNDFV